MIRYAAAKDEAKVLSMMELVKDDFAGYEKQGFLEAFHHSIEKKEAILAAEGETAAGMILFSKEEKDISFLAVHPDFRKKGVARNLIEKMKESFDKGDIIQVVTFRDGDPKGIAAIACYHGCGFIHAEELTVFDYPCQRLVLEL